MVNSLSLSISYDDKLTFSYIYIYMHIPHNKHTHAQSLYDKIDSIARTLETSEEAWSIRVNQLTSLQKIIVAYRNRPSVWSADILIRLSDPLASQIRDLRSTIVREVSRRRHFKIQHTNNLTQKQNNSHVNLYNCLLLIYVNISYHLRKSCFLFF